MKIKKKVIRKIWQESIATLTILSAILIICGNNGNSNHESILVMNNNQISEVDELPSSINEETIKTEAPIKTEPNIDQLVEDVNSGKAGNGDARREYLGEYYDEVQSIIDEQYKNKEIKTVHKQSKTGSKSEYQDYAYELCMSNGWSETDFLNLVSLWERESGWNPNAHNKSSGAHGIPQSLPASKMATFGDDYYTNGYTQIKWGINYILHRYGNPSNAWTHFKNKNWY